MAQPRHVSRAALMGAAMVVVLAGAGSATAQEKPIKLGLFSEFTGGSSGATSEAVRLGVRLAVEEINKAGGIRGRKLEIVTADTQTDATVGVGEMKRLALQEKVDLVIGPVISQIHMAAAPIENEAKIPAIGSTGSLAITPANSPYYFSTLVSADAQAKAMVAYAADTLKARSLAVLSDSGAQAKDFVEAMRREIGARGLKVTGVQEYQYRATDMTPQLLSLKRGAPDTLLLFASSGEDAGNALKSLGELGWDPKVVGNWTLGTFVDAMEAITGKEALQDVVASNYSGFTYCKAGAKPQAYLDLVARAKAFDPALAGRVSTTMMTVFYDATMLMKAAVEATGKTEGTSVAGWIEQHGRDFKGITAAIDPTKDVHFLYGPDALSIIYPGRRGEAGIQERVGC